MFLLSLVMVIPSGSVVLVGFAELNQTMNGPFIRALGTPTSTSANVFAVSKRNVIEVAHHSRDTECYSFGNVPGSFITSVPST